MPKLVSGRQLRRHSFCPRITYLEDVIGLKPKLDEPKRIELIKNLLLKSIVKDIDGFLDGIDDAHDIRVGFEGRIMDASKQKRGFFPSDQVDLASLEALKASKELALEYEAMVECIGLSGAKEYVRCQGKDLRISSENLGLSVAIDKLLNRDFGVPVNVRGINGRKHITGEKIELCAGAILYEREIGSFIDFGFIECSHIGHMRPVEFTRELKEEVFQTRDEILSILDGFVPDACPHGENRRCASCDFENNCYLI